MQENVLTEIVKNIKENKTSDLMSSFKIHLEFKTQCERNGKHFSSANRGLNHPLILWDCYILPSSCNKVNDTHLNTVWYTFDCITLKASSALKCVLVIVLQLDVWPSQDDTCAEFHSRRMVKYERVGTKNVYVHLGWRTCSLSSLYC